MPGFSHTHYLSVSSAHGDIHHVRIDPDTPGNQSMADVRFSPIFPAYLSPDTQPTRPPTSLEYLIFAFCQQPYVDVGELRSDLTAQERSAVYFSQGLASLIFVNFPPEHFDRISERLTKTAIEYWSIEKGRLVDSHTRLDVISDAGSTDECPTILERSSELDVYSHQIRASVNTLWYFYSVYCPSELSTVKRIVELTNQLCERYASLPDNQTRDVNQHQVANAIISALVEISAALSYAVTQGCMGAPPILQHRSPFPHHSLLGVGGAIRAITKFTRYLESAFMRRNAAAVIEKRYSTHKVEVPTRLTVYHSSDQYLLKGSVNEEFDQGGEFRSDGYVPLIVHFSLRHGFKESKFSVTAASEALTCEVLPQWTLMTLSHEVMHNRVRGIFQGLFGATWDSPRPDVITDDHFENFKEWHEQDASDVSAFVTDSLRNYILEFCCAMEVVKSPRNVKRSEYEKQLTLGQLRANFRRNKLLAAELFVHFHDYYFAYACQPKMYLMSLWASWTKVAGPFVRPREYLVRSLATVACGTGLKPRDAFEEATTLLLDALDWLESSGHQNALFAQLRELLTTEETFAEFKLCYFIIDQVRRFFASQEIVSAIDRIEDDPFSEGSPSADDYTATIYVAGQRGDFVSPVRYALHSLFRAIEGKLEIDDIQWLTAWNALVISSQELLS